MLASSFPFQSYSVCRARFATVAFMFQRRGYVRVGLQQNRCQNDVEHLIEQALMADVDDWNELTSSEYSCEMEVCDIRQGFVCIHSDGPLVHLSTNCPGQTYICSHCFTHRSIQ
jgi:transcriptional/translational regulatory protein YebC/TACO1